MRIETPYSKIEALVVDDMATQQTTLRGQLAMLGIGKIDAAGSADDALRHIRSKHYSLILCDYNLNHKTDGQQLFEFLREQQLLPADCLFFMVTAESNYNSVAAASEHLPDAYLLKPITAGDIEERLKAQLEKRQALLAINQQLGKHDLAAAASACDAVLARKDRWYMHALQLKGQIELDLGRVDEARNIYLSALELRAGLMWAQIGLARAHKAAGKFDQAKQLAQDIIESREGHKVLAAYDVLAQSLEAQGDSAGALEVLKDSANVVPSARRQRLVAEGAYRNGDLALAKASYAKAWKSSAGSITAQPQDQLALAQTQLDLGEAKEALATLDTPPTGKPNRSNEFDTVMLALRAQAHMLTGDTERAAQEVAQALAATRHSKADFATIAVAKAALMTGQVEAGLKLLLQAVSADHENTRIQQLVTKALLDVGQGEQIEQVVGAATKGLKTRLHEAKLLFRNGQLKEALEAIETELKDYPENTTVLFEAAQMNCMSLRLGKQLNPVKVDEVRGYLARLDKLLPMNDRVAQMRRYFRDTQAALQAKAGAPATGQTSGQKTGA